MGRVVQRMLLAAMAAGQAAGDEASLAPSPPADGCHMALAFTCGAALSSCTAYPCATCESCVLGNQTSLGKAGCTAAEELAFCSSPPPLVCKHTDSRGDTYDLTGIPKVDGKFTKINSGGGHTTAWYHVGICGPPTMSATDPTVGCLPACDPPCRESPCDCGGKDGIDIGGEAVCQYDPDIKSGAVEYNSGLLDSHDQHWADGAEPGMGVSLQYTGGSTRGGCDPIERSTDIVVHCDPCNQANISFVDEPSKCHYRVNITSIAGCPTNKPPPAAHCPHLCDRSTLQCRPVPSGTPGANATLHDCAASCKKPPPPPPPAPLFSAPCIRVINTIPTANKVDIEIVQPSNGRKYTWKNYGFGEYSNWTSKFDTGSGTINIIESSTQKVLLSLPGAPLTPGPLVVAVKCPAAAGKVAGSCWPPSDKQLGGSVETIAASYVPPKNGSGVRLFNLSPDTTSASLQQFAKPVASAQNVNYGVGSPWSPVLSSKPVASTITDAVSGKSIATDITTPPLAPSVFTLWLIGAFRSRLSLRECPRRLACLLHARTHGFALRRKPVFRRVGCDERGRRAVQLPRALATGLATQRRRPFALPVCGAATSAAVAGDERSRVHST